MALEANQPEPAKSLPFQFCPIAPSETATLSELVKHLDTEVQKVSAEPVTSRTLKRTLDFLQKSIGVCIAGNNEPLQMSTLKTIRLLFLTDLGSDRNLFRLLTPPEADDEATMEFSTATTIPRDQEASKLIQGLTANLALEIEPVRVQMLSRLLGDREAHSLAEKLLLHVERTNDEVSATLREGLFGDDTLLALAFGHMAKLMDQFRVQQKEELNTPANEAMYTYLLTLPFRHFIQHYPKHLEHTRIQLDIGDIRNDAEHFCRLASGDSQWHHGPSNRVFSVNTFHHLLLECPDQMCDLVSKATSTATTIKQLRGHEDRAKRLLISYEYRSFDCNDPDAAMLTVYDIVAAFSSFRYQQADGQEYKPYWHGQTDQGKSPQRLFDKGMHPKDPHQHQGVAQIYLNRFYEYQAAFNGTTRSYRARLQYQTARLQAYQSALELKDIAAISMALTTLNFYCVGAAKDYVIEHLTMNR
ncbi:hypothetical protein LYZ86_11000 [Xanthomonas hortorum pv. cynarae]|uniref:hypothetical protein n=1 Tax=Xanthomonas hortorum TaxID=56454 RepID=UPI000CEE278E|nr:hypothetical protein [Xanthomonas hortorum]MCE4349791.1 hypothetical protein [Xanthomonas hortorum pv. cynarae]PPU43047.1 hypothetical protein XcyCFBP4188_11995 [Xanthomonas hortorum pv. cynarae]CAD0303612.1 hypothetical protein CFBP2044_04900 [Xanthomonas hortorum pv. cynarae]CAD0303622.1 hypothetical protein CFBP2044_04900 [Xanthomonas hortorum pv. cynarae]